MEFFDTIRQVRTNWKPYQIWEFEQQKKEEQNAGLREKYPSTSQEIQHAKQYGKTIVNTINIMDQHSIDKSEDVSVVIGNILLPLFLASTFLGLGTGRAIKLSKVGKKFPDMKPYWELISLIIANAVAMTGGFIWKADITKKASRVARFQTREDDLKDSRNFVIYNEEQIEKAKKIAETSSEVEEKRNDVFEKDTFKPIKTFKNALKTTKEIKKDGGNYNQWYEKYLEEETSKVERFKVINPPENDLQEAQKERDILLNTIKKIETTALDYYNNMEMATSVVSWTASTIGLGIGGLCTWLINIAQKHKKLPKSKFLTTSKVMLPLFVPMIASMIAVAPTNKLIKDAARIGRFKAKQDLLNNPENFIAYDEQQRKSVDNNVTQKNKKPKGLFARFKNDVKNLALLKKDYLEYKSYMDNEHKEELKLNKALKELDISDEQKNKAVQLQKKVFHSFEKLDEKAQRFTDDTDAAVDVSKQVLYSIIGLATRLVPIYIVGHEIKKANAGKMPEKLMEVLNLTFSGKVRGTALAVLLIPFIVPRFLAIPIIAKGVQIKKDAGKIGVMSAMKDLDDPKHFLNEKGFNQMSNSALEVLKQVKQNANLTQKSL